MISKKSFIGKNVEIGSYVIIRPKSFVNKNVLDGEKWFGNFEVKVI